MGQTALNVRVNARSRWAGVFGGVWMLVFVLLVPELVGQVPMAVLGALMILSGISALDLPEARSIWNTGGAARWAILATFLASLFLSMPMAVAAGVLTIVLYVFSSARDVRVRAIIPLPQGGLSERDAPGSVAQRGDHGSECLRQSLFCRRAHPGGSFAQPSKHKPSSGHFALAGPHEGRGHFD